MDVLEEPGAPAGPVEESVALHELGLIINLDVISDKIRKEGRWRQSHILRLCTVLMWSR